METLRILKQKGRDRGITYILAGGLALGIHGVSRQTGDIDLIIREDDRLAWREVLESLGYRLFHDHPSFMQFSPPRIDAWPVDLMMVDGMTFEGLRESSTERALGQVRVLVPSVEHLLAMKVHALKQDLPGRELKDLDDIIELMERAGFSPEKSPLARLCEDYGTESLYERITNAWKKRRQDPERP